MHKIQIIWWKSSHFNYSIGCLLEAKGTLILNFDPDNVVLLVETLEQVLGSNPDDTFLGSLFDWCIVFFHLAQPGIFEISFSFLNTGTWTWTCDFPEEYEATN